MIRGNAMAATASIAQLQRILDRLMELPRKMAAEVKPDLDRLLRKQFQQGTDPYGKTWAPLRPATIATGRRNPPLTGFTRRLRDGTHVRLGGGNRAGLRIQLGEPYGYFHQVGYKNARTGRRVPPRRILPQFGMPREWSAALTAAAKRLARRAERG
jgi:hypothetical protein